MALAAMARQAVGSLLSSPGVMAPAAVGAMRILGSSRGMALWSVEKEKGQVYRDPDKIIDHDVIERELEATKTKAKDTSRIKEILAAARERSFLTNYDPGTIIIIDNVSISSQKQTLSDHMGSRLSCALLVQLPGGPSMSKGSPTRSAQRSSTST